MKYFQTQDRQNETGGEMNSDNAQLFVRKMKEDEAFRSSVAGLESPAEMWDFLKKNGFEFNSCDLVKAMAACMAALNQTS